MRMMELMEQRHSVRNFTDKKIDAKTLVALKKEIEAVNHAGHMHFQLVTNEPHAFDNMLAHYGKFTGVRNYIAVVGPKTPDLEEKAGYYGERLVLKAQDLGLNTCWVALTFAKGKAKKHIEIRPKEKFLMVIAIGYGITSGVPHLSKSMDSLCTAIHDKPDWFVRGMEAAMLAPTAINQQKFKLYQDGPTVSLRNLGGPYSKIDAGIVKYHFEQGAGTRHFKWAD